MEKALQFSHESALEYFKELVDQAIEHQGVRAGELTSFYVVHLLTACLQRRVEDEAPLAIQLARALERAGADQRIRLKQIGDASLFVAGFFAESLGRKLVDVDYYVNIGGYAYGTLSRSEGERFASVFGELGANFVRFVDVLSEVSERTSCASNADLLRLYEKWLRTGSPHSGQLLVERGVVPNGSIRDGRVH